MKKYRVTGLRQFLADSLHITKEAVDKRLNRVDPEAVELAHRYTQAYRKRKKNAEIIKATLIDGSTDVINSNTLMPPLKKNRLLWNAVTVHKETGLPLKKIKELMSSNAIKSKYINNVLVTRPEYVNDYLSSLFATESTAPTQQEQQSQLAPIVRDAVMKQLQKLSA
jgi:hypothetical protein